MAQDHIKIATWLELAMVVAKVVIKEGNAKIDERYKHMDLDLGIVFCILAVVFFLLGLIEERLPKSSSEEEDVADHFIIILWILGSAFFFAAGVSLFGASETYYSVVSDTLETKYFTEYQPFGVFIIIWGFFNSFLLTLKVIDLLSGSGNKEEG